jgi:hypothetical protein
MSERKKDGTGELDDEQLTDVSGGLAVGVPPDAGGTDPVAPDLSPSTNVISPRDPASGLPTGKRMHKPFTVS